jgi:hypothetical protein
MNEPMRSHEVATPSDAFASKGLNDFANDGEKSPDKDRGKGR